MITQPWLHRLRRPQARTVLLIAGLLLVAAAVAVLVDRAVFSKSAQSARPELQRILDGLVTGRDRVAPGVTAYISGPHGTWVGSAGLANVKTGEPMRPDAPMQLDSNTKAWTAMVILQLVGEGKLRLDDTVERWLPGLLPDGGRITVRELLNHTSGLIDNNDITTDPLGYIGKVRDPTLRSEILGTYRREQADPTATAPPIFFARFAAALPLRSTPGTTYHYSNIGYEIAGLIAARAGGAPLATLFRQRIIEPLDLSSAAYQPQGEISGAHPRSYSLRLNGTLVDATGWYRLGEGGDAGIVADAADEGHFLTALMQGRLLRPAQLAAMKTPPPIGSTYALGLDVDAVPCAGVAYQHSGSSYSTTSSIFVSGDGKRVGVILLNGNTLAGSSTLDPRAGNAAVAASRRLFCAA
ncbi:MAG TPA: serine hydrolase domain-containing protein [Gaiellaceae bacterium]